MQNIDIKNFPSVSSVETFDTVVLSLFSGAPARITVSLLTQIIEKGILPTIGKDGFWYIGGENTNVRAEGDYPILVKTSSGIAYKYDSEDDTAYRPLVYFDELRLKYTDLTEEQVDSLRLKYSDLTEEQIAELQKPAADAMAELNKAVESQILGIEMDSDGSLVLTYGTENTAFVDGYISDDGEVVLEFNYE